MTVSPAIFLGDFYEERTRPIGAIPPESETGELLRTIWISADTLKGDPSNYWVLTIGRYAAGAFKSEKSIPFPQGFPVGFVSIRLTPEIRISRGDVLALQAKPTGDETSPLTGLSVIPEYARTGSRVR